MRFSFAGTAAVLCAVTLAVACSESPIESIVDFNSLSLSVVSGDGQMGEVGKELTDPLVVRVTRERGRQVPNYLVNFRVIAGGGSMYAGAALTDALGIAQDYWTLGPEPGENIVEVRAVDPTSGKKHLFGTFLATGVIKGPEICNGMDDDINGEIDDGLLYCIDAVPAPNTDGQNSCLDGWDDEDGDPTNGCELALDQDGDGVPGNLDCDDTDPNNFPGNPEACDGQDNDCNGIADAPGGEIDADGDFWLSCLDCNDGDPLIYPGRTEICATFYDDNCDGQINEGCYLVVGGGDRNSRLSKPPVQFHTVTALGVTRRSELCVIRGTH